MLLWYLQKTLTYFETMEQNMSHPLHHSISSVRNCGGHVDDYLPVHEWFCATWVYFSDMRHSQHRIDQLLAWFTNAQNGERLAEFYSKLAPINTGAQRAAIQLGWGEGWDAKTFGDHLQTNPELFERLVSDFRMNKMGPGGRGRHAGDPFPKSKRTMILVERDRDGRPVIIPARPMGWVLIELTEVPYA